jgi:TonB family protein
MPKPIKPLLSETQTVRQDIQFKDFGVLNDGSQSKASLFTSVTLNVLLLIIAVILGAAAKKTMDRQKLENLTFVVTPVKPPEPIRPKLIPPKPMPRPPVLKTIEPKILKPEVKIEAPKPVPMKPMEAPKPAVLPAPPKPVVAAAAPKPVQVNLGRDASVVNHDAHPTAVALGSANNPIAPSNRPATSNVNLGQRGLAGMPSTNSGGGPPATSVSLGSGQPNGSLGGHGSTGVVGVKLGVTGGTPGSNGNGIGSRPATVQLGRSEVPTNPAQIRTEHPPVRSGPQVIYKPRPVYTSEATALHLEGVVSVRIRVSSGGAVSVIGVTNGLGHGLDESAVRAVQMTRFKPALDASGNPTDWEGVVNISFQIAS